MKNNGWHDTKDVITTSKLFTKIYNLKGTTFVSFQARTTPKMLKTDNPFFDKVFKVVTTSGILNRNYQNMINKRRKLEHKKADFQAKERKWGVKLPNSPIIVHKKSDDDIKYYLAFCPTSTSDVKYVWNNGNNLSKEEVRELEKFLIKARNQAKEQGLSSDDEVLERNYSLDSIKKIKIKKENLMVV